MKSLFFSLLFIAIYSLSFAQVEDPFLFVVEDQGVQVSEFEYIYNKNNGEKADYSEKNLREYLDLYINFKLKVTRARELGLDTIKVLQKELAGYRKQLSDSYLVDNEVAESLIKEVYERKKQDLKISHILVNGHSSEALGKISEAKKLLDLNSPWKKIVQSHSQDKHTVGKDGEIGYVSSMLPDGFYEFENAIYNLKVGEYSDVVKTNAGYHIIKLTDKRPARGEIEVAHILIRKNAKSKGSPKEKMLVDSLYQALDKGGDWNALCKKYSQDKKTSLSGGRLDFFGINKYERAFEDAAFSIKKDGAIAKPVESQSGWHIIKRLSVKKIPDYNTAQKRLKHVVSKSDRSGIAREALIEQIKEKGGFKENKNLYASFVNTLDKEFFSYKWAPAKVKSGELFSFKRGVNASLTDFVNYCKQESKIRLRFNKSAAPQEAADKLYKMYVGEKAVQYEESNLENKYPEFKALMREYSEGILLFEATEREVWNKASSDTIGLNKYYEAHKENYFWEDRAKTIAYTVNTSNAKELKKVWKDAKKMSAEELLKKHNTQTNILVSQREVTFNKSSKELEGIKWKKSELSKPEVNVSSNKTVFYQIVEIMPKRNKALSEARGYVISDFQDVLEKEWVKSLREKYQIQINEAVLSTLIK